MSETNRKQTVNKGVTVWGGHQAPTHTAKQQNISLGECFAKWSKNEQF